MTEQERLVAFAMACRQASSEIRPHEVCKLWRKAQELIRLNQQKADGNVIEGMIDRVHQAITMILIEYLLEHEFTDAVGGWSVMVKLGISNSDRKGWWGIP